MGRRWISGHGRFRSALQIFVCNRMSTNAGKLPLTEWAAMIFEFHCRKFERLALRAAIGDCVTIILIG